MNLLIAQTIPKKLKVSLSEKHKQGADKFLTEKPLHAFTLK